MNGPGSLSERLRALPVFAPPPGGWARLDARRRARRRRHAMAGGGLALAASVLAAVTLVGLRPAAGPAPDATTVATAPAEVAQLINRSQRLESELAAARPQVAVWSSGRDEQAALIEQRLRAIDAQLNVARSPDTARALWRERVQAMNALVQLHRPEEPALQYASYQY